MPRADLTRAAAMAAAVLASTPAAGDETTFCNAFITTLPYTVTVQGHYCFNRNLSTAITAGAAITIDVDFVVLDLNNFKLGGGSAGPATQAVGILAVDHNNVTVRNGNIRGFETAIRIMASTNDPTTSRNNLVEHNVVDGNLGNGILMYGQGNVVRHNVVTNTGGSPNVAADCYCATGIGTLHDFVSPVCGTNAAATGDVIRNIVDGMTPRQGETCYLGVMAAGVAKENYVHRAAGGTGVGLHGKVCQDNIVTSGVRNCTISIGVNYP